MKLLLDTHPLLWWASGGGALHCGAVAAIADPANEVTVSAVSVWEAEIKASLGKLEVSGGDLLGWIRRVTLPVLDITADDAVEAGRLPRHHADPFDRMLVAQARRRGLTLVTRDVRLGSYGVATLTA